MKSSDFSTQKRRETKDARIASANNKQFQRQVEFYHETKDRLVEVVDRTVLRVAKDSFIEYQRKYNQVEIQKEEIIDFTQACCEVARFCSASRFAERLDASETVETNRASYVLITSSKRVLTQADAQNEACQRLSCVINKLKQ